jgi:TolB protein
MKRLHGTMVALLVVAAAETGCAQDVVVHKEAAAKVPIDLSGLQAAGGSPGLFRRTLEGDLERSGWFMVKQPGLYTVTGSAAGEGAALTVQCRLRDEAKAAELLAKSYREPSGDAARLAHRVADEILQAIKGIKGIASSRLLVIGNRTGQKEVYLCYADGSGLRQLTADKSISMAPVWSPAGNQFAYTSYKRGFPDTFLVDVGNGSRTLLTSFPGINVAGDLSPDGRELLVVLSKDGNPELYVLALRNGRLTRLTTTKGGEASPSWSPDGSQIVFVSDNSGSPQLYVMSRADGATRRLTARGTENVSPDWGANGWIAYCSRRARQYGVYIVNPQTGEERQVSPGDAHYEDPSWGPDGRHIACTRSEAYRSAIYVLDILGDPPVCLLANNGDWTSPSWSNQ